MICGVLTLICNNGNKSLSLPELKIGHKKEKGI
jgi:hypothetical protein